VHRTLPRRSAASTSQALVAKATEKGLDEYLSLKYVKVGV
jgi:hypothetical protein